MLPTLGLTKYKNVDLQEDRKNPFKININTEKYILLRSSKKETPIIKNNWNII